MKTAESGSQPPATGPGDLRVGGWIALFIGFLAIFILSPVRQISDASYSLLVSECVLRHGTVALDAYARPPLDPAVHPGSVGGERPYQLLTSGGHVYYAFPAGTSILSIPYVALSHVFGMSAVDEDGLYDFREERRMMFRLAALLMATLALLTYRIASSSLNRGWSLAFTAAVALTTQVWSTASRGLWSHTWAILLVVIAIDHLIRHEINGRKLRPVLLASVLVFAYFTRPTMAIGVAATGVYLALRHRKVFLPYAATVAGWFAVFVLTSWVQYGQLLPPYYRPTRLGAPEFWTGLTGNLVSPSRGLLVFLPHIVVIGLWLVRYGRRSQHAPLALLGLTAALGHLAVVASFPVWWGGHGYGPRLLTDAVPWLILPTLAAFSGWRRSREKRARHRLRDRVETAAAIGLTAAALLINGGGALAPSTNEWNWKPVDVDLDHSRVWDWSDAQFLAPYHDRGEADR